MARDPKAKFRAQRIDTGYVRKSHPFRAWRTWLTLIALALAVGWVAPMFAERHRVAASPGQVASVHAKWNTHCEECHHPLSKEEAEASPIKAGFEPLMAWQEPSDVACQRCHPTVPPHRVSPAGDGTRCIDCHLEHRAAEVLTTVAVGRCTTCHADLTVTPGDRWRVVGQDGAKIDGFVENHPEFAVWTRVAGDQRRTRLHLENETPQTRLHNKPIDPTNLKFSHEAHLEEPICGPPGDHPRKDANGKVELRCGDCHAASRPWSESAVGTVSNAQQPASPKPYDFGAAPPGFSAKGDSASAPAEEGEYMAPVRYAEHCAGCHPHDVAFEPVIDIRRPDCRPVVDPEFVPSAVPHAEPAVVRAFLWGLFSRYSADSRVLKGEPPCRPVREGQTAENVLPPAEWVADRVRKAEKVLYRDPKRCQFCHKMKVPDGDGLPMVLPTEVPVRWMPQGRFDHGAHRVMKCDECHSGMERVQRSKDVHLPSQKTCAKCHHPQGASDACSTCHTYHGAVSPFDMDGPRRIDEILAIGQ